MSTRTKWNNAAVGCVAVLAMSTLAGCGERSRASSSTRSAKPVVLISTEPTDVVRGSHATIRWSTTGATDCRAGGAWRGVRPISGSETFWSHDAGSMTFELSCTGVGGSTTNTATLIVLRGVSPPPEHLSVQQ